MSRCLPFLCERTACAVLKIVSRRQIGEQSACATTLSHRWLAPGAGLVQQWSAFELLTAPASQLAIASEKNLCNDAAPAFRAGINPPKHRSCVARHDWYLLEQACRRCRHDLSERKSPVVGFSGMPKGKRVGDARGNIRRPSI